MSDAILSATDIRARHFRRPPLLMLDRAVVAADTDHADGVKNVSIDEPFFAGHFPRHPIMPGVLQVETMVQLAVLGAFEKGMLPAGATPFLRQAARIKFRRPVTPGDQLLVSVDFEQREDGLVVASGRTTVDGAVTCEAATLAIGTIDPAADLRPTELAPACHVQIPEDARPTDIEGVMSVIPHRFPFLLIDRVMEAPGADGTDRLIALKNVTANESFEAACAAPFLPNCLQMEIPAQAGCVFMLARPENQGKIAYFMAVDDATFHAPVIAGDRMILELQLTSSRGRFGKGCSQAWVGDRLVAETQFKFAITDHEQGEG